MTGILTGLRNLLFSVEFLQDATCVSGYNRRLAGGDQRESELRDMDATHGILSARLLKLSVQFDF